MTQTCNEGPSLASWLRYPDEKFTYAVYVLAVGEGDIRDRLLDAYQEFFLVQVDLVLTFNLDT